MATLLDVVVKRIAECVAHNLAIYDAQPTTRWLTVRAAAEHLGLSANSIRALIKRNRIPYYRVEGRILLEVSELDRWVRSGGAST